MSMLIALAAGRRHWVGRRAERDSLGHRSDRERQCAVVDWRDVVAIACGDWHSVGLLADGTAVAAGGGPACDVSDWRDVTNVAAGSHHTLALLDDRSVATCGDF
ncbi:RCC1 domain-containing protein [Gordonia sp. MP11Mi]|uniref:Uncharacterized protein n=1 Tax=Gordonia sp. MP11Mi TaxID=3022769 RepID=A0AA97GX60_9ACTN